ncbi:MBL fold metallo-hydrolase [Myroides sp. LJL119]
MKIQQIYTNCMSHAAYYLSSENQCAVFDPLRDIDDYLLLAKQDNADLKYIFETHFHADFVGGHVDLMQKTGAQIVFGPTAKPAYKAIVAQDGQEFMVGKVKVKILHTPGHTMESAVYLIHDLQAKPYCIITGDTLFIGDVGRPDLVQLVNSQITPEILAGHMYDSLRNKILPLPDELIVYPNHGAGSACGKNISKETSDTLGNQKKNNYALDSKLTKEEFVEVLLTGLKKAPGYFPENVMLNINGSKSLDEVLKQGAKALSLTEFLGLKNNSDTIVLDTRSATDFSQGFIPGSIQIGLDGSFALWVGELIKGLNTPLLLICDKDKHTEVITRLARVGYDNVLGYLQANTIFNEPEIRVQQIKRLCPGAFLSSKWPQDLLILDVRKQAEVDKGFYKNSLHVELSELNDYLQLQQIDTNRPIVVYCQSGYRSMIACSILKSNGFENVMDVKGGYSKLSQNPSGCCSTVGCGK